MKIAATCDIHYDLISSSTQRREFLEFIQDMKSERHDVLIVAGDVIGLGWAKLEECMRLFTDVSPVRLMVFGNHDHWSTSPHFSQA